MTIINDAKEALKHDLMSQSVQHSLGELIKYAEGLKKERDILEKEVERLEKIK